MKLYAQALARRLHEQRVGQPTDAGARAQAADWPGYPVRPGPPRMLQIGANVCTNSAGAGGAYTVEDADRSVALPGEVHFGAKVCTKFGDASGGHRVEDGEGALAKSPGPPGEVQIGAKVCTNSDNASGDSVEDRVRALAKSHGPPGEVQIGANVCTNSGAAGSREVASSEPRSLEPARADEKPKVRVAERVKPLSQAQQNAIDLMVLGHDDTSVAANLGLHRNTVNHWRLYNPAFRAELSRRQQQVWGAATDQFRQLLGRAVAVMSKRLDDPSGDVQFGAARSLLLMARRFEPPDEPTDVEGVLTLEARRLNAEFFELHPAKTLVYEDERQRALELMQRRAGEELTIDGVASDLREESKSSKLSETL